MVEISSPGSGPICRICGQSMVGYESSGLENQIAQPGDPHLFLAGHSIMQNCFENIPIKDEITNRVDEVSQRFRYCRMSGDELTTQFDSLDEFLEYESEVRCDIPYLSRNPSFMISSLYGAYNKRFLMEDNSKISNLQRAFEEFEDYMSSLQKMKKVPDHLFWAFGSSAIEYYFWKQRQFSLLDRFAYNLRSLGVSVQSSYGKNIRSTTRMD